MSTRSPDAGGGCGLSVQTTHWVRGELDAREAREFEAHLASCPACREAVDEIGVVVGACRRHGARSSIEFAQQDPSSEIVARGILERARAEAGRVITRHRAVRWLSAAAAVIVVGAVIGIVLASRSQFATSTDSRVAVVTPKAPDDASRLPAAVGVEVAQDDLARRVADAQRDALAWLVTVQDERGAWSPGTWGGDDDYRVGVTGLAVMALASSESSEHEDVARAGVAFLLGEQRDDGVFGPSSYGELYNHSVATLALLDFHARHVEATDAGDTRAERLRGGIDRALDHLVAVQTRGGAWGYSSGGYASGRASGVSPGGGGENLSVSIWPVQCLVKARELGWPNLDVAIERGFRWLEADPDAGGSRVLVGHGGHVCGGDGSVSALGLALRDAALGPSSAGRRALDAVARASVETASHESHEVATLAVEAATDDASDASGAAGDRR